MNTLKEVPANQLLTINYNEATQDSETSITTSTPIFKDITSDWLNEPFVHQENPYDDYKDQVLLPHKFSQLGPCIAVADVNQDGLEDFYIGGASGQIPKLSVRVIAAAHRL